METKNAIKTKKKRTKNHLNVLINKKIHGH